MFLQLFVNLFKYIFNKNVDLYGLDRQIFDLTKNLPKGVSLFFYLL